MSDGSVRLCGDVRGNKTKEELRAEIVALESVMLKMTSSLIHIEPKHYFAPGLYLREIFIPKGVTLTGKIHKTEHLCILSKGRVSVYTEDGIKEIEASTVVPSLPGTKRVMYAHEDSVWINCHHNPSDERDLEKIDDVFVVDTFDQFKSFMEQKEQKQLEGGK